MLHIFIRDRFVTANHFRVTILHVLKSAIYILTITTLGNMKTPVTLFILSSLYTILLNYCPFSNSHNSLHCTVVLQLDPRISTFSILGGYRRSHTRSHFGTGKTNIHVYCHSCYCTLTPFYCRQLFIFLFINLTLRSTLTILYSIP